MDGLLLVNKPKGITSFDVIRQLRRATGVRKIGHAGTLDPLASGLMLVLFGSGCKQAPTFSKLNKTYQAEITLGWNSSTGDAEGDLTEIGTRKPGLGEIKEVLKQFVGQIEQTPSIYSAIKVQGKEAYKYARQGQAVEVPKRTVTIYSLQITDYSYPILKLEAKVSSGTYIRSLSEDIGKKFGTGAYLSGLVRTEVGQYGLDQAEDLDKIDVQRVGKALHPIDKR